MEKKQFIFNQKVKVIDGFWKDYFGIVKSDWSGRGFYYVELIIKKGYFFTERRNEMIEIENLDSV